MKRTAFLERNVNNVPCRDIYLKKKADKVGWGIDGDGNIILEEMTQKVLTWEVMFEQNGR